MKPTIYSWCFFTYIFKTSLSRMFGSSLAFSKILSSKASTSSNIESSFRMDASGLFLLFSREGRINFYTSVSVFELVIEKVLCILFSFYINLSSSRLYRRFSSSLSLNFCSLKMPMRSSRFLLQSIYYFYRRIFFKFSFNLDRSAPLELEECGYTASLLIFLWRFITKLTGLNDYSIS